MSVELTLSMSIGRTGAGAHAAPWVGVRRGMHNGKEQTVRELLCTAIDWTAVQQTFPPFSREEHTPCPTNSAPGCVAYFVPEIWAEVTVYHCPANM